MVMGLSVLVLVALATTQWGQFAIAAFTAERRPSLLEDAEWGKPTSDTAFRTRFRRGVAERELTTWLLANKFQIDPRSREASRSIGSLPCSEAVKVIWQIDQLGRIQAANAEVSEAGCL